MAVNDELIAINASHAIYVNRLAAGMGNKSQPFIDDINKQIEARLAEETGRNLTTKRREALLKDIASITSTQLKEYTALLKAEQKEFGGYEGSFQAKSVNGLLVNAETVAVGVNAVNEMAQSNLIKYGGSSYTTYNEMMNKYWVNNTEQITNIVANGYSSGISTREVANQVMNEVGIRLGKTKSASKGIAVTGLNHYANMARKTYFEENKVVIGVRRIATVDSKTSQYCRGVDQTVVLKSDPSYSSAFPPFHPFCRSDGIPELDSRYTQDDDGGDRATNFKQYSKDEDGKIIYDGLNPKPVDSINIYYDSLKAENKYTQDAILGPTLGKAFRKLLRDGGTPAQFAKLTIDPKLNKSYTITELKAQDNALSKILNKQRKQSAPTSIPVSKSISAIKSASKAKVPSGDVNLKGGSIRSKKTIVTNNSPITSEQSAYLEYYKGSGFYDSNKILRNKASYSASEINQAQRMNDSINSAAERYSSAADSTVFRGADSKELFDSISADSIGATIDLETVQSSSVDARTALNYAGSVKVGDKYYGTGGHSVIYEINIPKGSSVIDMENVVGNTGEGEILIPSTYKYKVTGVEDRFDDKGNTTLKLIKVDLQ